MSENRRKSLFERISKFVWSDETTDDFHSLSLNVFEYQYNSNEAYRKFCEAKEKTGEGRGKGEE